MGNKASTQIKPQKAYRSSEEILSYSNARVIVIASHGEVSLAEQLIVPDDILYFSTGEIGTTTTSDYDRKIATLFSPKNIKNTLGYFTGLYGYISMMVPTIRELYFKVPRELGINKIHKISKYEQQQGEYEGNPLFGLYTFDRTNGELIKVGNKDLINLENEIVKRKMSTLEIMSSIQKIYPNQKLILIFLACSDLPTKGSKIPYSVFKSASGVTSFSIPKSSAVQSSAEKHPEMTYKVLQNMNRIESYTRENNRIVLDPASETLTRSSSVVESASIPSSFDIYEIWQKKDSFSQVVFEQSLYMPHMSETRTLNGLKRLLDDESFKEFLSQLENQGFELYVRHTTLTPQKVFSSSEDTLAEFIAENCGGGCCSCRRYRKKTRGGVRRKRVSKQRKTRKLRR